MDNKPTNYETFIQTIKQEDLPDILQGYCKCSHCTNYYWDGGASFCHQNANDSNCNKGINEWMSLTTTEYYDIIKNGKKYLYQVPLKYYQELYEIVQLISDYNETHFPQKEILRYMQRHINADNVKIAIQKLLDKINSNEWKLRLKEKEEQKNENN